MSSYTPSPLPGPFTVPSTYRAAIVKSPGTPLEIVNVVTPEIRTNEVLIRVEACGLCHGDSLCVFGSPMSSYPRCPGHEISGVVVKVGGDQCGDFKVGHRVARGWHGGHCNACKECRRGKMEFCRQHWVTGLSHDGGYAEYNVSPVTALSFVPDGMSFEDSSVLTCAGLTCFNALRRTGVMPPAVVAVNGIGGLGHLCLQYAHRMGYKVVAISTSEEKKEMSLKCGAHHFINSKTQNAVAELLKLGGARIICETGYDAKQSSALLPALDNEGQMLMMGVDLMNPMEVRTLLIVPKRAAIQGIQCGHGADTEQTMEFSSYTKVKPQIELFGLDDIQKAYDRMISGKALFRVVVTPHKKQGN